MEIRNLQDYIQEITQNKPNQIGVSDDPLLIYLSGKRTNIVSYIENLTNFAVDSSNQVFYEMLQNADDAGSSIFYVFFDENNLIFFNNAKPFNTDNSEKNKGQLHSFLARNKSDKNIKDGDKGKYGQGSKLIYDLLCEYNDKQKPEERLKKAIIEDLKGPVIFSWNKWSDIEKLILDRGPYKYGDYKNNEISLLTKIIYTYYPAFPEEKIKTKNGIPQEVFTKKDLAYFIDFFKNVFSSENTILKGQLTKGTAIYLRLGKGQYNRLADAVNNGVKSGISTSLIFLSDKIKDVRIQGELIKKVKYIKEELAPYKGSPYFVEVAYPKSKHKSDDADVSNFFQYFPITKERRGFSFVINSTEISIQQSRQEINLEEFNEAAIKHYGKELSKLLERKKNERSDFLRLFATFLKSDENKNKGTRYHELLYIPIIQSLKKNIPLEDGSYTDQTDFAILKSTSLNINLSELGINKKFIDTNIAGEYYEELITKLGIRKWNINDILTNAENSLIKKWISSLSTKDYTTLLNELNASNSLIKDLPFIKFSNNEVFSFNEIVNNKKLLLLTNKTVELKTILSKIGLIIGGEELLQFEKFNSLSGFFKDKVVFRKVNNSSLLINLLPQYKRKLLKVFINNFDDGISDLVRTELKIFKNIKGETKSLKNLIYNTRNIAQSTILNKYQINPSEILDPWGYEHLFMDITKELLPNLYNDWSDIIREESTLVNNINAVYKDLNNIISHTDSKITKVFNLKELPIYLTSGGKWVEESSIFCNPILLKVNEKDYQDYISLIERISYYYLPNKDALSTIQNSNQIRIKEKDLFNVVQQLKNKKFDLINKHLKSLADIGNFLNHFVILEENINGFIVSNKYNNLQYYSQDNEIIKFLNKKVGYFLLPERAKQYFNKDELTIHVLQGERLLNALIDTFGSKKEFVNAVEHTQSLDIKKRFIELWDRIELFSNQAYEGSSSYYKLFNIAKQINKQEEIKCKIYLDNEPLIDFLYNEDVKVNGIVFSLSDLLEEYKGKSDVVKKIKKKFKGVSQGIFDTASINTKDIVRKLLQKNILDKASQITFLIAVKLSDQENEYTSLDLNNQINFQIPFEEIIDSFYHYKLEGFQKHFSFFDFAPGKHFYQNIVKNTLLKKEIAPDWLLNWVRGNEEKINFLKTCDNNVFYKSQLISYRKDCKQSIIFNEIIDNLIYAENKVHCDNTLEWCSLQKEYNDYFLHNLINFIEKYIERLQELPVYLLIHNNELRLDKINYNKAVVLSKTFPRNKIEDLWKNNPNFNYQLIDFISDKQVKLLNNEHILTLGYDKKLLKDLIQKTKEWNQTPYIKWIEDKYIKHRIFISQEKIPFEHFAFVGNERYLISSVKDGDYANIEEKENNNIFLSQSIIDEKSILSALKENHNELKIKDFELIELFDLFEKENQQLLKEIEKNNKTNDEIIDLIKKEKVLSENTELIKFVKDNDITTEKLKSLIKTEGEFEGKYKLSRDLNNKELDALNKILIKINEKLLIKLANNIDKLKKIIENLDETDADKNPVTGYIGEMVVYYWLINKYGKANVKYVADKKAEFDIILSIKEKKFFIDVKTTIKSLKELSGAIAFYIKQSQYDYIKDKKLNNYYITRLSLKDIGLDHLTGKYKGLDIESKKVKQDIKEEVKQSIKSINIENSIMIFNIKYDDYFTMHY